MKKIRIGLLFGGRSSEHDVSLLSAANVARALDRTKYEIVPIGITRDGKWTLVGFDEGRLPGSVPPDGAELALIPGGKGRIVQITSGASSDLAPIDVLFPVLHGPFGEDGTVQGYAEIADVAYVGCGVGASAAAMDKDVAKRLLRNAGIPVANSELLHFAGKLAPDDLLPEVKLPAFVKPARQGSSVGVSKVETLAQLRPAVEKALQHDCKVLIEEFVDAREIELAVLEHADGSRAVSMPGEIISASRHGFYTYEAKYVDADGAIVKVPADLPDEVVPQAQQMAGQAFDALGCEGLARVDLFLQPDMTLLVNEVNTMPGFTDISMYPKAIAASGIPYSDLLDELIEHALGRYRSVASV